MKKIFLILFLIHNYFLFAQKNSYQYPVNKGKKTILTGNLGEIRGSHFHAGLDIALVENTQVYASEDGYVSLIQVSSFGYGKMLMIVHPKTKQKTLYGHLSGFSEKINTIAVQEQYRLQKFEINLKPKPKQILVKKGELIAYSGNTGHSGGPHLHYEIRNMQDVSLNPAKMGFSEIPKDKTAPLIKGFAIRTIGINSRVEDAFGRKEFFIQKKNKKYVITKSIYAFGWVGLELFGYDKMDNSQFKYSLNEIEVFVNNKKTFSQNLDKIPHTLNRAMNVHIDYKTHLTTNKSFQKLYVADGNPLDLYSTDKNKGVLKIEDRKNYKIKIIVKDDKGNQSILELDILGKKPAKAEFVGSAKPNEIKIKHQIFENTLKIEAYYLKTKGSFANLSFNGMLQQLPLAYQHGNKSVYLWDLRKGMPDKVSIGKKDKYFYFKKMIPSGQATSYEYENIKITFPQKVLFDTLYLELQDFGNAIQLGSPTTPLMDFIKVTYKVKNKNSNTNIFLGTYCLNGIWKKDTIRFETKNFGFYQVLQDKIPPDIQLSNPNVENLAFKVKDNLSGVDRFKATLNDKFILLDYEHKNHLLRVAPFKRKKLKGKFKLNVWDKIGNMATYEKVF